MLKFVYICIIIKIYIIINYLLYIYIFKYNINNYNLKIRILSVIENGRCSRNAHIQCRLNHCTRRTSTNLKRI